MIYVYRQINEALNASESTNVSICLVHLSNEQIEELEKTYNVESEAFGHYRFERKTKIKK